MPTETRTSRRFGWAWLGLTAALAIHVTDEALTGFLSVYNPTVIAIRRKLPGLPLPVFSVRVWLTLLILAVLLLLALTIFAFRGARWMRVVAYPYGALMLLNGLNHIAGSFYLGRLVPGVYSAPLLLAGSTWLLWCARK